MSTLGDHVDSRGLYTLASMLKLQNCCLSGSNDYQRYNGSRAAERYARSGMFQFDKHATSWGGTAAADSQEILPKRANLLSRMNQTVTESRRKTLRDVTPRGPLGDMSKLPACHPQTLSRTQLNGNSNDILRLPAPYAPICIDSCCHGYASNHAAGLGEAALVPFVLKISVRRSTSPRMYRTGTMPWELYQIDRDRSA